MSSSKQRCRRTNNKGKPCKGIAIKGSGYCWDHSGLPIQAINGNELTLLGSSSKTNEKIESLKRIYQEVTSEAVQSKTILANSQKIRKELIRLEASKDCLTPEVVAKQEDKIEELKSDIKKIEQQLTKARLTSSSIASLKQDPQLLTELEENELKCKLEETEKVLSSIQGDTQSNINDFLRIQEEARKELECVICLEVPHSRLHIFSCNDHHLICQTCKDKNIKSCPVCRHVFGTSSPKRNRIAEKMIEKLT